MKVPDSGKYRRDCGKVEKAKNMQQIPISEIIQIYEWFSGVDWISL